MFIRNVYTTSIVIQCSKQCGFMVNCQYQFSLDQLPFGPHNQDDFRYPMRFPFECGHCGQPVFNESIIHWFNTVYDRYGTLGVVKFAYELQTLQEVGFYKTHLSTEEIQRHWENFLEIPPTPSPTMRKL